ncbi:MAG: hypothetical protein HC824_22400 [Synechococcales cyanobacterium RM1_1_8]|nr:hypothetical protein [Synechococcales cyanobacterium RM1_1_8]
MTPQTTTCACPKCNCQVNLSRGLQKNGQYYCSEACASGHANNASCGGGGSCGCGS